jgi:hypothetical protein
MAERRGPGATGHDGHLGLDDAGFGDDARDAAAFGFDAACGALLDHVAAQLHDGARHGRCGLAGSAVPSVGEKTPPFQARPVAWPRSAACLASSM